jgi:hypothetical protein
VRAVLTSSVNHLPPRGAQTEDLDVPFSGPSGSSSSSSMPLDIPQSYERQEMRPNPFAGDTTPFPTMINPSEPFNPLTFDNTFNFPYTPNPTVPQTFDQVDGPLLTSYLPADLDNFMASGLSADFGNPWSSSGNQDASSHPNSAQQPDTTGGAAAGSFNINDPAFWSSLAHVASSSRGDDLDLLNDSPLGGLERVSSANTGSTMGGGPPVDLGPAEQAVYKQNLVDTIYQLVQIATSMQ